MLKMITRHGFMAIHGVFLYVVVIKTISNHIFTSAALGARTKRGEALEVLSQKRLIEK